MEEDIFELELATEDDVELIKEDLIKTLTDFYPLTPDEIFKTIILCLSEEEFLFTGAQIKDVFDTVLAAFSFS